MQQIHNIQNDGIGSVDAPSSSAIVELRQYPMSVLVWVKTPLGFVEEGVKINQKVYQRDILKIVVLPWAQKRLGNAN
ncbi:uncharacterized protein TNCV_2690381 [Trichonephila clavipes]|uniref:Uncharacterized protein n=1 Tax=Trichonephila clavipes TaxID=2585209 RepID=A0A8X6VYD0_TRICX|nr:uncharacterized protein TNCV_2690381 [Trichonephila clavipes]